MAEKVWLALICIVTLLCVKLAVDPTVAPDARIAALVALPLLAVIRAHGLGR